MRVGDLVHLSNNENVPADILLLRSSNAHGVCYIDTCDLDGESNLKSREVSAQENRNRKSIYTFVGPCRWSVALAISRTFLLPASLRVASKWTLRQRKYIVSTVQLCIRQANVCPFPLKACCCVKVD